CFAAPVAVSTAILIGLRAAPPRVLPTGGPTVPFVGMLDGDSAPDTPPSDVVLVELPGPEPVIAVPPDGAPGLAPVPRPADPPWAWEIRPLGTVVPQAAVTSAAIVSVEASLQGREGSPRMAGLQIADE